MRPVSGASHAALPRRSEVQVLAGSHLEAVSGAGFDVVILSGEPVATRYLQQVRALMPGAAVIFDAFELGFVGAGRQNRVEGDGLARLRALDIKQREVSIARGCDMTWTSSRADERWLTMAAPELRVEVVPPVCDVTRPGPGFHERAGVVLVRRSAGAVADEMRNPSSGARSSRTCAPDARTLSYEGLRVDPVSEPSSAEGGGAGPPRTELRRGSRSRRCSSRPFDSRVAFPFEVVHAMAQGVPVVTTTVGAEGLDLRDA